MATLTVVEFQLLSQLLQAIFFGIYAVTLGFCLKALLRTQNRWKRATEINRPMLVVTLVMGCVATFDTCLTFAINVNALALYDGPGGPKAAFDNTSGWMDIMGSADVIIQTVLGDVMLIYRCWIVYGRSWLVIACPVLLAIAGLVCIGMSIYLEVTLPAASQFASPYKQVVTSTWALTICINVITTSLIVVRIWRADRKHSQLFCESTRPNKNTYHNARRIIIESGLMYTTVATITAITYITGSDAFAPLTGVDIEMIGISFNLILIRVHRNRTAAMNEHNATKPAISTLRFGPMPDRSHLTQTDTVLGETEQDSNVETTELNRLGADSDASDSSQAVEEKV
ncbi:hypothetical protein B0H10DRAFT_55468 [Mycena sp. CBHHK59/15]|nr:hypothetical protein B0H10DRAFT_55468 [Mycena sp. CBHHK59/15]